MGIKDGGFSTLQQQNVKNFEYNYNGDDKLRRKKYLFINLF
jgi:hypothetical protein